MPSVASERLEDMPVGGAAATLVPGPRAVVRGDPRALRCPVASPIGNALVLRQS